MYEPSQELGTVESSTERLSQSWNGFTNTDSTRPSNEYLESFKNIETLESKQEQTGGSIIKTSTINFERYKSTKPRTTNYYSYRPQCKTIKMPKSFPGVKTTEHTQEKQEEIQPIKKVKTQKQAEKKLTLDDIEKVLTPRREQKAGMRARTEEKLPRIKITKAKTEVPNDTKSSVASPQAGSHHFNCARMLTELNEICSMKAESVAGYEKSVENLLKLKTVHEARRYSAFTPRGSGRYSERALPTRCQSLPNLSSRNPPKRFFVKLDPIRASAMQVNLSSRNDTSRRCRVLSENLNKLDMQGIELDEEERRVLIGQWIRETSQLNFDSDDYAMTEAIET